MIRGTCLYACSLSVAAWAAATLGSVVAARAEAPQLAWPGDVQPAPRLRGWATTVHFEPRAVLPAPVPATRPSLPAVPTVTAALPPIRAPKPIGQPTADHALSGIASYYWQEQMTANGERFDKSALTAAHKTLPFGTRVKVTDQSSGKTVVVRINDRGPFKPGRVIDLSEAAAQQIGMTGRGLAAVKIEVVSAE